MPAKPQREKPLPQRQETKTATPNQKNTRPKIIVGSERDYRRLIEAGWSEEDVTLNQSLAKELAKQKTTIRRPAKNALKPKKIGFTYQEKTVSPKLKNYLLKRGLIAYAKSKQDSWKIDFKSPYGLKIYEQSETKGLTTIGLVFRQGRNADAIAFHLPFGFKVGSGANARMQVSQEFRAHYKSTGADPFGPDDVLMALAQAR